MPFIYTGISVYESVLSSFVFWGWDSGQKLQASICHAVGIEERRFRSPGAVSMPSAFITGIFFKSLCFGRQNINKGIFLSCLKSHQEAN